MASAPLLATPRCASATSSGPAPNSGSTSRVSMSCEWPSRGQGRPSRRCPDSSAGKAGLSANPPMHDSHNGPHHHLFEGSLLVLTGRRAVAFHAHAVISDRRHIPAALPRPADWDPVSLVDAAAVPTGGVERKSAGDLDPPIAFLGDHPDLVSDF